MRKMSFIIFNSVLDFFDFLCQIFSMYNRDAGVSIYSKYRVLLKKITVLCGRKVRKAFK